MKKEEREGSVTSGLALFLSLSLSHIHTIMHKLHAITHMLSHIVPVILSPSKLPPSPPLSYVSVGNTFI